MVPDDFVRVAVSDGFETGGPVPRQSARHHKQNVRVVLISTRDDRAARQISHDRAELLNRLPVRHDEWVY